MSLNALLKPTDSSIKIYSPEELYSIDLTGTVIQFRLPVKNIENDKFFRPHTVDLRPYINIVSRSDFRTNLETKRGYCDFYESGWYLSRKQWWKKENLGYIKFIASLITPAKDEYEAFPNLFDTTCLEKWLPLYYRDRQSIVERSIFREWEDGTLQIDFYEKDEVPQISPDEVPLKKLEEAISSLPCYFLYLNPDIIEFNIPVTKRDVLQFRFQLRPLTKVQSIIEAMKTETLSIANSIIHSLEINLHESVLQSLPGPRGDTLTMLSGK